MNDIDLFLYQCSLVVGNLFLFLFLYIFDNNDDNRCIGTNVNYYMFAGLTVLAIAGVLVFILITPVKRLATGYTQLDHSHPKGVLQRMGTALRKYIAKNCFFS
jgi:hypothetical protein